jgi:hypothetical protein
MGGKCCSNGQGRGVQRVLVGKPEEMRPMGRPRCKWEDNTSIKMDLQELVCGVMGWIALAPDRDRCRAFVNTVINLLVS